MQDKNKCVLQLKQALMGTQNIRLSIKEKIAKQPPLYSYNSYQSLLRAIHLAC